MDARAFVRGVLVSLTILAIGLGSARAGSVFASAAAGTEEFIHDRRTTTALGAEVHALYEDEEVDIGASGRASVVAADSGFALRIHSAASDGDPGTQDGLVSQSAARVTDRLTVRVGIFDLPGLLSLTALATMRVTGSISHRGGENLTSVIYAFNGANGEVHDAGSYNLAIEGRDTLRELELGLYEYDIDARLSSFCLSKEGSGGFLVNFGNSAELVDLRFVDQDGREVPVEITSELGLNYAFAVPEPGSVTLMVVGMVGVVVLARRR